MTEIEEDRRSERLLKGTVRYGRVIPLPGPGMRSLSLEWTEEYFTSKRTAEEVTFSMEARMRRTLQDAGLIK